MAHQLTGAVCRAWLVEQQQSGSRKDSDRLWVSACSLSCEWVTEARPFLGSPGVDEDTAEAEKDKLIGQFMAQLAESATAVCDHRSIGATLCLQLKQLGNM